MITQDNTWECLNQHFKSQELREGIDWGGGRGWWWKEGGVLVKERAIIWRLTPALLFQIILFLLVSVLPRTRKALVLMEDVRRCLQTAELNKLFFYALEMQEGQSHLSLFYKLEFQEKILVLRDRKDLFWIQPTLLHLPGVNLFSPQA